MEGQEKALRSEVPAPSGMGVLEPPALWLEGDGQRMEPPESEQPMALARGGADRTPWQKKATGDAPTWRSHTRSVWPRRGGGDDWMRGQIEGEMAIQHLNPVPGWQRVGLVLG